MLCRHVLLHVCRHGERAPVLLHISYGCSFTLGHGAWALNHLQLSLRKGLHRGANSTPLTSDVVAIISLLIRAHINGKEEGRCTAVSSFPGVEHIETNNCEMCYSSFMEHSVRGNSFY